MVSEPGGPPGAVCSVYKPTGWRYRKVIMNPPGPNVSRLLCCVLGLVGI